MAGSRIESKLPGLAAWVRVLDYREQQIRSLRNVEVALESEMEADDIVGSGFPHVVVATGARWRGDGVGRWHLPVPIAADPMPSLTPDDLMAGDAEAVPKATESWSSTTTTTTWAAYCPSCWPRRATR